MNEKEMIELSKVATNHTVPIIRYAAQEALAHRYLTVLMNQPDENIRLNLLRHLVNFSALYLG